MSPEAETSRWFRLITYKFSKSSECPDSLFELESFSSNKSRNVRGKWTTFDLHHLANNAVKTQLLHKSVFIPAH